MHTVEFKMLLNKKKVYIESKISKSGGSSENFTIFITLCWAKNKSFNIEVVSSTVDNLGSPYYKN